MSRAEIQERVRQLIRNHVLGCESHPPLWAGSAGDAKPCSACGLSLVKGDVEYEVTLGKQTLHFHPDCHTISLEECAHR